MEQQSQPSRDFGKVILTLPNGIGVREWLDDDAEAMSYHASNKKVWDNLRDRMPYPYTLADAVSRIEYCRDPKIFVRSGEWDPATGISSGPAVCTVYAITVNEKAIGSIGLEFRDPNNVAKRTAELGYWIGEEFWSKGIMSIVVPAFVDWTWKTFGILLRLDGYHYEWNIKSGKLLEKAGFVFEGRREAAVWKNGRVGADMMYGCLRPKFT